MFFNNINDIERIENNSFILIQKIISSKLEIVEEIKDFIRDRNLHPTFKNEFCVKDFNNIKNKNIVMDKSIEKYVILGIQHFETILTQYNDWKKNNIIKKIERLVFPDMSLTELKDDVIDYSEQW
jgi:hypothetical protein